MSAPRQLPNYKDFKHLTLHQKFALAKKRVKGRTMAFLFLRNIPTMTFKSVFDQVGQGLNDFIRYCDNDGKCNNITEVHSTHFPKYFGYNMLDNKPGPTVKSEGISHGVSLIFMSGGQFASVPLQGRRLVNSFFANTYLPSSAAGIRITITAPGVRPSIDSQGLDISPGFSTLIAITGKETIRLPWPHSDCTHRDDELLQLRQSLLTMLG